MPAIVAIVAVFVLIAVIRAASGKTTLGTGTTRSGTRAYDRLLASGTPARGILLQVDAIALPVVGSRFAAVPMQRRQCYLDVEIPGQPPYEVQAQVMVPLRLADDVLPGATVELRVDPGDRNNIIIVGPGAGFAVTRLA